MSDLRRWLKQIGLPQYSAVFSRNHIDLSLLRHLTEADLETLGISARHRRKILTAIRWDREDNRNQDEAGTISQRSVFERPRRHAKAERRQVTVMFCDLVNSTKLSERLDPEDFREVILEFQAVCEASVARFSGHIAKYLGDGILVYFGYPKAHEDDAQRAVRAGLAISKDVCELGNKLQDKTTDPLQCRIGVHTGLVVAGDMGTARAREEFAIIGETPNIASRLEQLAEPNSVIIGPLTYRLVTGLFDCEDIGSHTIKGISHPIQVFAVRGVRKIESRFEATRSAILTRFVGRQIETGILLERWARVRGGVGQTVLIEGAPGIGKSRLAEEFGKHLADTPHLRLRYQCSAYHANSPLYPVIQQFERAAAFRREDSNEDRLAKMEALLLMGTENVRAVAPLFASMLSIPDGGRYQGLNASPQRLKERTIEALVGQLIGLADMKPVLFVMEDVHWVDPTTLEVLDLLIKRVVGLRVLMVITFRPEFGRRWHGGDHITYLCLDRLGDSSAVEMVRELAKEELLPDDVRDQIVAETDGVPLFIEELTRAVLEAERVASSSGRYVDLNRNRRLAIPSTLHDSLIARLDQLASQARETAQLGATIGREFSHSLLSAVSPLSDRDLNHAMAQLLESQLIQQRGHQVEKSYIFKHALIRDAAYETLLRSERRQLHERIAIALEDSFPEVKLARPEVLAHHYVSAGLPETAVPYWLAAGQLSIDRCAYHEAEAHLTRALEEVLRMPFSDTRDRLEFGCQALMAQNYVMARGYASKEAETCYMRARDLAQQISDLDGLFRVLYGVFAFYLVKGDTNAAIKLSNELLELREFRDDAETEISALIPSVLTSTYRADLIPARDWALRVFSLYDRQRHSHIGQKLIHDPLVLAFMYLAHALWMLGFPDQAAEASQRSLQHARELGRQFDVALALQWAGMVHLYRRDTATRLQWAEECIAVSDEYGFPFEKAYAEVWRGWAIAAEGEIEAGIKSMEAGLGAAMATGSGIVVPYVRCLIAEALGGLGKLEESFDHVKQALAQIERWNERFHEAELWRIQGELHVKEGQLEDAKACFENAVRIARMQHAKSWELRTSTSLARLLIAQQKPDQARRLLAPICGWFTEGFGTGDLRDALRLLEDLA